MKIFIACVVFVVSWLIGVFGFCQIIGSAKTLFNYSMYRQYVHDVKSVLMFEIARMGGEENFLNKKKRYFIFMIILWGLILFVIGFCVNKWLNGYLIELIVAYVIAFFMSTAQKSAIPADYDPEMFKK